MNKPMLAMDLIMLIYWLALTYIEHQFDHAPDAPEWEQ
jgi:hypothetical protein